MKKYTRKQAEKILKDKGLFWSNCHDLRVLNDKARKEDDLEVYHATLDLNGYVLGY